MSSPYWLDAVGALKHVISSEGPLCDKACAYLRAIISIHIEDRLDIKALRSLSPNELGEYSSHEGQFIMGALLCWLYAKDKLLPNTQALIEEYQDALGVGTDTYKLLVILIRQRIVVSEQSLLRAHLDRILKGELHPYARQSWTVLKETPMDSTIESRYQSLKTYPKGSLGYGLSQFYETNSLPLPGSQYGVFNGLGILHDIAFVIGGYDLSDEGRLSQAAFQAGFTKHHGMLFIMIALMHCYLDSVITRPSAEKKILFDKAQFDNAYEKGRQLDFDLYDNWDYWSAFKKPLDTI